MDDIAKYYDKAASRYDKREKGCLKRYFYELEGRYIDDFVSVENKKLLDMGTGTGRFAFFYAGRADEVIGIDISTEMINIAESKKRGWGYAI